MLHNYVYKMTHREDLCFSLQEGGVVPGYIDRFLENCSVFGTDRIPLIDSGTDRISIDVSIDIFTTIVSYIGNSLQSDHIPLLRDAFMVEVCY